MIKKLFNKIFNSNDPEVNSYHPEIISFQQGFDLTELPICTLSQNGNKFNFLLDTGSNDNIIDSNILNKIEHELIKESSRVFGLEGQIISVSKCLIDVSYRDIHYKCEYLIKDMSITFNQIKQETGVTIHGLIGSKFFNKYKYVLDFDELIAYSKL